MSRLQLGYPIKWAIGMFSVFRSTLVTFHPEVAGVGEGGLRWYCHQEPGQRCVLKEVRLVEAE